MALQRMSRRLHALGDLSSEGEAMIDMLVGESLEDSGARKIWSSRRENLNCETAGQWTSPLSRARFDVCWSELADAADPSSIIETKRFYHGQQEDQIVKLFLAGVAYGLIEVIQGGRDAYALAVLSEEDFRRSRYWRRMIPQEGNQMVLRLRPRNCTEAVETGPDWIDPIAKTIIPQKRSTLRKIFGKGTNQRFVGLFHRPGELWITCTVTTGTFGDKRAILYQPFEGDLRGTDQALESWWP